MTTFALLLVLWMSIGYLIKEHHRDIAKWLIDNSLDWPKHGISLLWPMAILVMLIEWFYDEPYNPEPPPRYVEIEDEEPPQPASIRTRR